MTGIDDVPPMLRRRDIVRRIPLSYVINPPRFAMFPSEAGGTLSGQAAYEFKVSRNGNDWTVSGRLESREPGIEIKAFIYNGREANRVKIGDGPVKPEGSFEIPFSRISRLSSALFLSVVRVEKGVEAKLFESGPFFLSEGR
jgi:hypothetical protein